MKDFLQIRSKAEEILNGLKNIDQKPSVGNSFYDEVGGLISKSLFDSKTFGKTLVKTFREKQRNEESMQLQRFCESKAKELIYLLENEIENSKETFTKREYSALLNKLTQIKSAKKFETIFSRIITTIMKIEEYHKKKSYENETLKKIKHTEKSILIGFYERILQGEYPEVTEEMKSILSIPKNESLLLEKKIKYNLNGHAEWLEFIRDILSIANAITSKPIGLFIGIDDETGQFIDTHLPDEAEIRQMIQSKITPEVNFVLFPLKHKNDSRGYVIVVQPSENIFELSKDWISKGKKIASKGDIWVRKGSRKEKLDTQRKLIEFTKKKSKIFLS